MRRRLSMKYGSEEAVVSCCQPNHPSRPKTANSRMAMIWTVPSIVRSIPRVWSYVPDSPAPESIWYSITRLVPYSTLISMRRVESPSSENGTRSPS